MADDLIVEVLDQNWVRKGITNRATKASITDELGQVGEADVEVPIDDPVVEWLPNPDAVNPYEGRFNVYEDNDLKFSGVIDATTKKISSDGASVSWNGKHRGVLLGFYNTGRVDYLGWNVRDLLRELTRNNIAKEFTLVSASTQDELYPAYQMVTGDPFKQNYWKTTSSTPTHTVIFDGGSIRKMDAIRVMPQWWKDIDTLRFHYHNFIVSTSPDGSTWTTRGTKSDGFPSSSKGHLYETPGVTARYVRLQVTGSSDGFARIAQLMVYENVMEISGNTTYTVPFIDNDDAGNVSVTGTWTRPIVPGAFQGDSVITHSYVTQLEANGVLTHTFRGASDAVFFTSGDEAQSTADIYVDGGFQKSIVIPTGRYWFKGFDTYEDMGVLLDDTQQHTLEVRRTGGNVRVDYFNGLYQASWRPIEDDDPSIAYLGTWTQAEHSSYFNFYSSVSEAAGNELHYNFYGDRIRVMGSKASGYGSFEWYIDGALQGTVSASGATAYRQTLANWSGSYGSHTLRLKTTGTGRVVIDRLEGNFNHTMYMRARYETNLKVLIRMSEIIDSYVRFNNDGSLDLLGAVGDPSPTAIIEGENEGGTIVSANVGNDYSETGSAVLAIVNVNGEMPIKAFVIDKEAVAEIGFKVIKLEQSDAADQFLLNRQALQYLREKRKPNRAYDVSYDPDEVGDILVGQTTRLYSPSTGLEGDRYRVGRITTEYVKS